MTLSSSNSESKVTTRGKQSKKPIQCDLDKSNRPLLHRFVTNWLITDPKYYQEYALTKPVQNYHVLLENRYVYFLGGRWRSAKAKPIFALLVLLIAIPAVLFWIFEASWCWHNISPALVILFTYFWLLAVSFFIRAGTSDPGILPRNIHIPSGLRNGQIVEPPQEYFNSILLPYNNDVKYGVTVKYCTTCHIWRPPRASHCGVCNACVMRHDHHCVYLNNCVGSRNYMYFIWCLLLITISCGLLITTSLLQTFHYIRYPTSVINTFAQSVKAHPISLLLSIYGMLGIWYPLALLLFHIFLTAQDLTTRDYLNQTRVDSSFKNVFTTGNVLKNLYINWLGRPRGNSLVRLTDDYQQGDIRFEKVEPLRSFE